MTDLGLIYETLIIVDGEPLGGWSHDMDEALDMARGVAAGMNAPDGARLHLANESQLARYFELSDRVAWYAVAEPRRLY